jgi:hypothetical protein
VSGPQDKTPQLGLVGDCIYRVVFVTRKTCVMPRYIILREEFVCSRRRQYGLFVYVVLATSVFEFFPHFS